PIDLVAVNLYPFRETIARPGVTFEQAIEQIDIGGPSILRSAAKNHQDVIVVVDPDDYPVVLSALKSGAIAPGVSPGTAGVSPGTAGVSPGIAGVSPGIAGVSPGLRREFAAKVFAHTAAYDAAIHGYLVRDRPGWPERITLALERRQELRYGENPHQAAALYALDEPGIRDVEQLHGKELSFNNLLDVDAALAAVAPWSGSAAASTSRSVPDRPGRRPRWNGKSSRGALPPRRNGPTCGSPGRPSGQSSRTRSCSPSARPRSASAPGRCRGWMPRFSRSTRRASKATIRLVQC